MSTVRVEQSHSLSTDDAKKAVDVFAEESIKKFGMKLDWSGNSAKLKGTGASGSVKVEASTVTVEVKLGMLARAAGVDADRLRSSIERKLAAALSNES